MTVKVGIGVIIFNAENKLLLGERISEHGYGTWGHPGGHLEFGETPFQCAIRETLEETGIKIENIHKGPWINAIFNEHKHYITLFTFSQDYSGEAKVLEKDKCARWAWFEWNNLPTNLFKPFEILRSQYPTLSSIKAYLKKVEFEEAK